VYGRGAGLLGGTNDASYIRLCDEGRAAGLRTHTTETGRCRPELRVPVWCLSHICPVGVSRRGYSRSPAACRKRRHPRNIHRLLSNRRAKEIAAREAQLRLYVLSEAAKNEKAPAKSQGCSQYRSAHYALHVRNGQVRSIASPPI
jgi:hypothetical protein